jgi:GNAT superfamily N-acetyltransferase
LGGSTGEHADFRFDLRYRALTGSSRRGLERELEHGFPTLPAGCHIELDRVTTELVLRNVRSSLRIDWRGRVAELRRVGDRPLGEFLEETGLDLDDIYRRRRGGWAGLRRLAGLEQRPPTVDDDRLAAAIGRMLHLDDQERLGLLRRVLGQPHPPALPLASRRERRLLSMLHFSLWGAGSSLDQLPDGFRRLWDNPGRLQELSEVADLLQRRIHRITRPVDAEASESPKRRTATWALRRTSTQVRRPTCVTAMIGRSRSSGASTLTCRQTSFTPPVSPYDAGMAISYEWRGEFTSAEANRLHAECFDHPVLSDQEWDWRGQVDGHSLGWVSARDGDELVGFVNVAWDGVVHAFVLDTMVATRARRDGVGTRLVELAVEGARAAGCEWLHVDFEDHLRGFYFDACGFVPTNAGLIEL